MGYFMNFKTMGFLLALVCGSISSVDGMDNCELEDVIRRVCDYPCWTELGSYSISRMNSSQRRIVKLVIESMIPGVEERLLNPVQEKLVLACSYISGTAMVAGSFAALYSGVGTIVKAVDLLFQPAADGTSASLSQWFVRLGCTTSLYVGSGIVYIPLYFRLQKHLEAKRTLEKLRASLVNLENKEVIS